MRVLLVEDDRDIRDAVEGELRARGFAVDAVGDLDDAEFNLDVNAYDCCVFDRGLPSGDAVEVVATRRRDGDTVPVLFLTARDTVADRVDGFEAGGDDYLVKPFAFDELVARVRALTRRHAPTRSTELSIEDLVLDTVTRRARRGDRDVELTTKEYAVLEYFLRNPDAVITRGMIEEHAWNNDFDSVSNLVDVYIRRLRSKIDVDGEPSLIETIRGAGYRLRSS